MNWLHRLFITMLLVVGWLVVGYFYVDYTLESPKRERSVTIEIPPNSSVEEIGVILKNHGLIRDNRFFRLYVKFTGKEDLVAGIYKIQPSQDLPSILDKISSGKQDLVKVTIPEGKNIYDIAEILQQAGFNKEEFLEEVNRKEAKTEIEKQIVNKPNRTFKLEGYLFPATYEFKEDATAEEIVTTMVKEFEKRWNKVGGPTLQKEQNRNLDELVTIASLIERESRNPKEKSRVSGVIYNRIAKKMELQIDASTIYAYRIKGEVKTRLYEKDLMIHSPYNLYPLNNPQYDPKVQPLPPGPIASPGEGSLQAALQPEKHNFLYYIVDKSDPNSHKFFTSYNDFVRYKNSR